MYIIRKRAYVLLFLSVVLCYAISVEASILSNIFGSSEEEETVVLDDHLELEEDAKYYDSLADMVEDVMPAVVTISATQAAPDRKNGGNVDPFKMPHGTPFDDFFEEFRKFFPNTQPPAVLGGSGFIVHETGIVVTNYHVVENPEKILVSFNNEELEATLLGKDKRADIAVLKINEPRKYPYLKFTNSDNVRTGDSVIAMGNPLGVGKSVSSGIVSAKSRDIVTESLVDFIQTDAALNKGNSGGPLVDIHGRVVGVNTLILSNSGGSNIGIGFAISSNYAKPLVDKLMYGRNIERGWLGVIIQPVTKEIADSLKLGKVKGALLNSVEEGTPAHESGLKAGDVVIKVDDIEIEDMNVLRKIVAYSKVGQMRKFVVLRRGKEKEINVRIGKLSSGDKQEEVVSKDSLDLGAIIVRNIENDDMDNVLCKSGVVVQKVKDGKISNKGLGAGDIIMEVAYKPVSEVKDLDGLLQDIKSTGIAKNVLVRVCIMNHKNKHTAPYYMAVPLSMFSGE